MKTLKVLDEDFTLCIEEIEEIQHSIDSVITIAKLMGYTLYLFGVEKSRSLFIKDYNDTTKIMVDFDVGNNVILELIRIRFIGKFSIERLEHWYPEREVKELLDLFDDLIIYL